MTHIQREVLRLVMKNFVTLLAKKLPPSGQPSLHDLEARSLVLIEAMPAEDGPAMILDHLTVDKVNDAIEWLFTSLVTANTDNSWAIVAAHSLRLHALAMASAILQAIVIPPRPLGIDTEAAQKGS